MFLYLFFKKYVHTSENPGAEPRNILWPSPSTERTARLSPKFVVARNDITPTLTQCNKALRSADPIWAPDQIRPYSELSIDTPSRPTPYASPDNLRFHIRCLTIPFRHYRIRGARDNRDFTSQPQQRARKCCCSWPPPPTQPWAPHRRAATFERARLITSQVSQPRRGKWGRLGPHTPRSALRARRDVFVERQPVGHTSHRLFVLEHSDLYRHWGPIG